MALSFTLRQLYYFVAVGEAGSIAEASDRINVSSPSLSTAISRLEEVFGVELFIRQHAQGLSLTPGGRQFYSAAKELLENAQSLHDIANDIAERCQGPISVGCLVTIAPFILLEIRRSFESTNPQAYVRQTEAHQGDLIKMLRRADIDVALTYDLSIPQDVECEPLLPLPAHALFSPDHRFAKRKNVSLNELVNEPLVLLDLPLSNEYFLSLFAAAGLRPKIAERTSSLPMARSMVANNFGYRLLNVPSKNINAPDGKPLSYIPLEGTHRPMTLGMATMRSERKSRIVDAFEAQRRNSITGHSAPGMSLLY